MPRAHWMVFLLAGTVACGSDGTPTLDRIDVAEVGFRTPESVRYDDRADAYLVSNINGRPLDADGNGFISRLAPDGTVQQLRWIDGEASDVTLNAPKGMAFSGDTLFVADIDHVRLFDRTTGAALGARAVPGATFLNDLAVDAAGTLYATDSGLDAAFEGTGTDALWRFDGATPVAVVRGAELGRPNGVATSDAGVTVVTFGSGAIYRIDPVTGARTDLPIPELGQLDGVILLDDGSMLVSSWAASAVYRVGADGTASIAVDSVLSPADIGWDGGRRRVLVPIFSEDRVVIRGIE